MSPRATLPPVSTDADIWVSLPCPVATPSTPGEPRASLPSTLTPTANELSVTSLTTERSDATWTTMPTRPVPTTTGMFMRMPERRTLADLDRVVEVGDGARDHRRPHGAQVADEREVGLLQELLVRLLGHPPGRDLALHGVDLGLQLAIVVLQVVVLERAVPEVADGAEHRLGAVADRGQRREHAGAGLVDGSEPAEVQRQQGQGRQHEQDQGEPATARPPGEGHGAWPISCCWTRRARP